MRFQIFGYVTGLAAAALLPLGAPTARQLLICDIVIGAALLALWNVVAASPADSPGGAIGALAVTVGVVAAGLAAGAASLLRLALLRRAAPPTARGDAAGNIESWALGAALLLLPLAFAPRLQWRLDRSYDWRDFRTAPYEVRAALKIGERPQRPWRTATVFALLCTKDHELRLLERTALPKPKPNRLPARYEASLSVDRQGGTALRLAVEVVAVGAADTVVSEPLSAEQLGRIGRMLARPGRELRLGGVAESGVAGRSLAGSAQITSFVASCR